MSRVEEVFNVTLKMKELLNKDIHSSEREAIIERLDHLLQSRETLLKELKAPYSEEEKVLGKKLIKLNTEVQDLMNQLFDHLKVEMKQVNKQKKSTKNYVNPYRNVAVMDGMFMDKKK